MQLTIITNYSTGEAAVRFTLGGHVWLAKVDLTDWRSWQIPPRWVEASMSLPEEARVSYCEAATIADGLRQAEWNLHRHRELARSAREAA